MSGTEIFSLNYEGEYIDGNNQLVYSLDNIYFTATVINDVSFMTSNISIPSSVYYVDDNNTTTTYTVTTIKSLDSNVFVQ